LITDFKVSRKSIKVEGQRANVTVKLKEAELSQSDLKEINRQWFKSIQEAMT